MLNVAARSAAARSITCEPSRCSLRSTAPAGSSDPKRCRAGERFQHVVGRVDLPPAEAWRALALIGVVVVVPSLAHGEEGEEPVVAGVVAGHIALAPMHVGERIDAEGAVIDQRPCSRRSRPRGLTSPRSEHRTASTAAGTSSNRCSHISSGIQVRSPTFTRSAVSCCGRRSSRHGIEEAFVTGRVHVVLGVGMKVVMAVLGGPPQHALLRTCSGPERQNELEHPAGRKARCEK